MKVLSIRPQQGSAQDQTAASLTVPERVLLFCWRGLLMEGSYEDLSRMRRKRRS